MKFVLAMVLASVASALAGGALAMVEERVVETKVVQIDSDWIEIDGTFTAE